MKVQVTYEKTITVYIPEKKYDPKTENFPAHVVQQYIPPHAQIKDWSIIIKQRE